MKPNTTWNDGRWCQLSELADTGEPLGAIEKAWQTRLRLKRLVRHGAHYVWRLFAQVVGVKTMIPATATISQVELVPGDFVCVRSREEIERTLDARGKLARCGFMDEMWQYCGTTHRVLKRVEQFLDERDQRIHRVHHIVLLDGVICEGTRDYGRCDRACFFFWREEWLEKIELPQAAA